MSKGKFIAGLQDIRGKMILFGRESDFSIEMRIGEFEIIFISELLWINGHLLTYEDWDKFPKENQKGFMSDEQSLEWFKEWKSFLFTTHKALVMGHKEK